MPNRPTSEQAQPVLSTSAAQLGTYLIVVSNGEIFYAEEINELRKAMIALEDFLINSGLPIKDHNQLINRDNYPSHTADAVQVTADTGSGSQPQPLQQVINFIMNNYIGA